MELEDQAYMAMAVKLARQGQGLTAPNPMVGAVIVKDQTVIGSGYHQEYGGPHAERNAIDSCQTSPKGGVLYVTLEPCCHHGKQPPCVDAILKAGIRRVVVGSPDPNPLVSGRGIRILREQGVEVTEHVLQEECDRLNPIFFHYIRTGLPYVICKYAMTLDGKTAAFTGASQWITGEAARAHVQQLRGALSAIMVGVNTVIADDPLLTCRLPGKKSPVRVICDSRLRTPLSSRIVQTASQVPTLLATCCQDEEKTRPFLMAGCQILQAKEQDGHLDLADVMRQLGKRSIDSLLLEGGGTLCWSALRDGLVQRVMAYLSPLLLGGSEAKTPIAGQGFPHPGQALPLIDSTVRQLGSDFLIEGEVESRVYRTH